MGLFTLEDQVQFQVSPFGIFDGQRVTGTGFAPIILAFPCQHHSPNATHTHTHTHTHTNTHTHTHTQTDITGLHSLPNIRVIKSRKLRLARHVARIEKKEAHTGVG
jgi:hypothetical protein